MRQIIGARSGDVIRRFLRDALGKLMQFARQMTAFALVIRPRGFLSCHQFWRPAFILGAPGRLRASVLRMD
jgi:hypothetical protein